MAIGPRQRRAETQEERRARQRAEEDQRREEAFERAAQGHADYSRNLQAVARQISNIIHAYSPTEGVEIPEPDTALARLEVALRRYQRGIEPWARSVAWRMLQQARRRDATAWRSYAAQMGIGIKAALASAPLEEAMLRMLGEQVELITSLPTAAIERLHEKNHEMLASGGRYAELLPDIEADLLERNRRALEAMEPDAMQRWLTNRATLIARTETARAQSVLVQTRAEHVGSTHFIWKTAGDWKVRQTHRQHSGNVYPWNDPPQSEPNLDPYLPGQGPNCRCTAIPVIPGQ